MKLLKTVEEVRLYELTAQEGSLLMQLLRHFPFSGLKRATISQRRDEQTAERELLLNESLKQHREELKRAAASIAARITPSRRSFSLELDPANREVLIQIMNDIRIGAWQALGEPETFEIDPSQLSSNEQAQWQLMQLAGFFQMGLIESES